MLQERSKAQKGKIYNFVEKYPNIQRLQQLQSQDDWTVFLTATISTPTRQYHAYYGTPTTEVFVGRFAEVLALYDLDPTDPTAAVTPNAMVYVIDRTANNWVPITLMVLHVEFDFIITM